METACVTNNKSFRHVASGKSPNCDISLLKMFDKAVKVCKRVSILEDLPLATVEK